MSGDEVSTKKTAKPPFRARLRVMAREAVEIYGRFDPRSMGLARIGLGLLLIWDLLRRVPDLATWYSNEGLLPNHTVLWRPSSEYMFSFFFAASRPSEAAVMFVLSGIVFFLFTIGYRTRFFHILSFACMVSLHDREIFTENGGDRSVRGSPSTPCARASPRDASAAPTSSMTAPASR